MAFLRANLSRIAALAVLLWLCAAGIAFAQSCTSPADVECDHCWMQAKPSMPKAQATVDVQLTVVAFAPREPAFTLEAAPVERGALRGPGPADLLPRDRIPIEFLRLAL